MTYAINVNKHPQYIHVMLTEDPSDDELSGSWSVIAQACKGLRCDKILVESQIEEPRITLQVYDLVHNLNKLGFRGPLKVAFVTLQVSENLRFAESIISNTPFIGRAFSDTEEARTWLLS